VPGIPGAPAAGQPVIGSGGGTTYSIESYFQTLYNSYISNVKDITATVTVSVCHSSCHSSCHNARGRR
jgi:hypothetical protein